MVKLIFGIFLICSAVNLEQLPLTFTFQQDPQKPGCLEYYERRSGAVIISDIGLGCYDRPPIYH